MMLAVTLSSATAYASFAQSATTLAGTIHAVAQFQPRPTGLPTISGTVVPGQTLAATQGPWANSPTAYAWQWKRCDATGNNCTNISAATASTYVPGAEDAEYTLRVDGTASNAGGSATATSLQTTLVSGRPVNTGAPGISGVAEPGQTLSATPGTWTGTPTPTYTYQWQQCNAAGEACTTIPGATATGYVPEEGDLGHTLRVAVTATNAAGNAMATSAQTIAISSPPVNTLLPSISGTAQQGQTLSATSGTWNGIPAPTYAYQWKQCNAAGEACTTIGGATSSTYAPVAGDVGHTLRVAVTATNTAGNATATSTQTVLVNAPLNTVAPSVSGTVQQGKTLTAATGTWLGTPAPAYTYQWNQCNSAGEACTTITGATTSTYIPAAGDGGFTLRVAVTATNTAGTVTATSAQTVAIITTPLNTVLPSISGTAQQGQTLTGSTGTWSGYPAATYTYQWQQCDAAGNNCTTIGGATTTYVPVLGDGGHTLRLAVTATNTAANATATSTQTAAVATPPVNTVLPSISGTVEQGKTLSSSTGTWLGTPTPTYTYQWQRCNAGGEACTTISGATASTYVLVVADGGDTIRVAVTATNSAAGVTATSAQTVLDGSAPVNTVAPTVSGTAKQEYTVTGTTGTWSGAPTPTYTYQWQRCNGACANISGATATSYKATSTDVGYTLRIAVTATNSVGAATAYSAQTAAVVIAPPVNIGLPCISFIYTDRCITELNSETSFSITRGTWTNSPTSFSWHTYTTGEGGDLGGEVIELLGYAEVDKCYALPQTVWSVVTATNAGGSTSATTPSVYCPY